MSKVLKFKIESNWPGKGCTIDLYDKKGRLIVRHQDVLVETDDGLDAAIISFRFEDGEMADEFYQILPNGEERRVLV